MRGKKSTDAEYQTRVLIVTDMLLSGLSRAEILQNIANIEELQKWGVSESQVDNYIRDAKKSIYAKVSKTKDQLIGKAYREIEFLKKKLIHVKDYKSALSAVAQQRELFGLDVPKQVKVETVQRITIIDDL